MAEDYSATQLLKWYVESGINEALEEKPINHFLSAAAVENNEAESIRIVSTDTESHAIKPAQLISQSETTKSAYAAARAADTLEALRNAMSEFEGCPLKQTAKNLVFGDGLAGSRLMLIGEAPGAQEDREGRPFVGQAGQLLERMLKAISIQRNDAYITNILPWRPPGNRTPTDSEIGTCLPFIQRQIELVAPEVLILIGGVSAKTLLGTNQGIMRTRGKWLDYKPEGGQDAIPARAILHPAYLLRSPAQKRETWMDLLEIQQKIGEFSKKR